jgi:lipopolysaccharide/colanic/teichoic acid biosynthesis glycosyltransferase
MTESRRAEARLLPTVWAGGKLLPYGRHPDFIGAPGAAAAARRAVKRAGDAVLAAVGLMVSAPLWALICAAIMLEDGRPVFFFKECVGRHGRTFRQLKFRSMVRDAERATGPVLSWENDPRITRVGALLRKTALDELPQLVNILRGEMSFVGPRPQRAVLVAGYVREIPNYARRHLVRPGLTGLAQVRGRYHTPPRHKLRYDLLYVGRAGLMLDLKLLLASFWVTAKGKWSSRERKR